MPMAPAPVLLAVRAVPPAVPLTIWLPDRVLPPVTVANALGGLPPSIAAFTLVSPAPLPVKEAAVVPPEVTIFPAPSTLNFSTRLTCALRIFPPTRLSKTPAIPAGLRETPTTPRDGPLPALARPKTPVPLVLEVTPATASTKPLVAVALPSRPVGKIDTAVGLEPLCVTLKMELLAAVVLPLKLPDVPPTEPVADKLPAAVTFPLELMLPTTSSLAAGVCVPMPTLPLMS